jgi:hypothetical protein
MGTVGVVHEPTGWTREDRGCRYLLFLCRPRNEVPANYAYNDLGHAQWAASLSEQTVKITLKWHGRLETHNQRTKKVTQFPHMVIPPDLSLALNVRCTFRSGTVWWV